MITQTQIVEDIQRAKETDAKEMQKHIHRWLKIAEISMAAVFKAAEAGNVRCQQARIAILQIPK